MAEEPTTWRALLGIADRSLPRVVRVLARSLVALRRELADPALVSFVRAVDIPAILRMSERAIAAQERVLDAQLPDLIILSATRATTQLQIAAGFRSAGKKKPPTLLEESADALARAWAKKHAGALIVEITSKQRAAVRKIIDDAIRLGRAPKVSAEQIRKVVGLTEDQADRVASFLDRLEAAAPGELVTAGKLRVRIPAKGLTPTRRSALSKQYADRLHTQRAMTIARTETLRATNEGQQALWKARVNNGLMTGQEQKQWIVTPDDRLCPQCAPLDGALAPLNGTFSSGVSTPPLHPNCRCTIALVPVRASIRRAS